MSGITTYIGNRGEEAAVQWLRERGYYIVERNWRAASYEIDIIAEHFDTLHFIEVKTRHISGWQSPFDSIDERKMRSLRRAATLYRTLRHLPHKMQFDLVAITIDDHGRYSVEYIENLM